jgi:hypothetical protein
MRTGTYAKIWASLPVTEVVATGSAPLRIVGYLIMVITVLREFVVNPYEGVGVKVCVWQTHLS